MSNWKELSRKMFHTLREDGIRKAGEKTHLYLRRKREEKAEGQYTDRCFRDVLFVNGCDENLPHPGRYRVSHQREQLESLGMTTGEVYYQNLEADTVRCYRSVLFFRCPYTDKIGEFVALARELNKTVFYDVDDLVIDTAYTDEVPYLNTMDEKEREAYDENVRSMRKLLRLCDGAVTTTSQLAQELEQYVPRVLINRNTASEEMVQLSQAALREPPEEDGLVRIGYFSGSITHNDDFAIVLPVLASLLGRYENLRLVLVGDLDLPDELQQYRERLELWPFLDWRRLPELLAKTDINLAPLANTIFNRAKSENKWMEAALVKTPTVASDIGAFREMIENGVTGILCSSRQQWEEALTALIEQKAYRELIGQAAWDYCMQHCVTALTGGGLADFLQSTRRRNTAFVLPSLQVSGGVMVALQHARMLQESGTDVLLLSIEEGGKERWHEFEGCRLPVLNLSDDKILGTLDLAVATMWSTLERLERAKKIVRKAYLVQGYEPDLYSPGDPHRMQARETYGFQPNLRYLTISAWCRDWLGRYGHRAFYAPNGLEVSKFQWRERKMQGKIRILIEGDCTAAYKNVDESFRIVSLLDRGMYEIWYMAYHGTPKEWYPIDKFLSQVPYGQVQEIYRDCDILLKTSLLEGFSYPPLEMMATGGFVVAVLNEGNREYLEHGVNCLTYPAGDIAAGAEAIETLRKDALLRSHLAENGRKTAQGRDWSAIREDILRLYRK